ILAAQPGEARQLIVEMIGLQQADQGCSSGRNASLLHCCSDLIANVRSGIGAQPLSAPPGCKEYPPMPVKQRAQSLKCLVVIHSGCAAVVIQHYGKRSFALGLVKYAMKCEISAWKRDDARGWRGKRSEKQKSNTPHAGILIQ